MGYWFEGIYNLVGMLRFVYMGWLEKILNSLNVEVRKECR